jgi:hypothetical protein
LAAVEFDHGPLVQWTGDPTTTAQIRWLERAESNVVEGRWASGPAGFGYGDGDDATVLSGMAKRYDRLAIRRKVALPAALSAEARLFLRVNYDDGFIAWLGGKEVARRNVEAGADGALKVPEDHEAGKWEEIELGTAGELLGKDGSVLALQGFNVGKTSSDFTLDARLEAKQGGKTVVLSGKGAVWEYLAGKEPEENWRNEGGVVVESPPAKVAADAIAGLNFRAKGEAAWRSAAVKNEPFAASRHRVRSAALEGLPPGREIELQLAGKDGSLSKVVSFRSAPAGDGPVRFVTGGDLYHSRAPMDAMNRRAGLEDPLFALLGGDLAYTNNAKPERWFDFIDSWVENARTPDGRLLPVVVAIGNHEVTNGAFRPLDAPGPTAATEYMSLFHLRREGLASDTFDLGKNLSFVLLDSGHAATIASQTAWLESVLEERRGVKRLFVCYHRPAWGAGVKEDAVDIQREWCPLFERFKVDAVFENDHHVFSRSHPLVGGKIDEVNGIPYLGSGSWSVEVRKIDPAQLKKRPWIAKALGVNHLYVVEVGGKGWSAEAKTADGKGFDRIERPWRR